MGPSITWLAWGPVSAWMAARVQPNGRRLVRIDQLKRDRQRVRADATTQLISATGRTGQIAPREYGEASECSVFAVHFQLPIKIRIVDQRIVQLTWKRF
jgi:hypothetical protein